MATNDQPMQEPAFINGINEVNTPNVMQKICLPSQSPEACAE